MSRPIQKILFSKMIALISLIALSNLVGCAGVLDGSTSGMEEEPSFSAKPHPCTEQDGIVCGNDAESKGEKFSRSAVYISLLNERGVSIGSCTGVVVDERAILTAAHCLTGEIKSVIVHFSPVADDFQLTDIRLNIVSSRFKQHPNYNHRARAEIENLNDIGIIFLKKSILSPYTVIKIAPARPNEFPASDDNKIYSLGFGRLGTHIQSDKKLRFMTKKNEGQQFHFLPQVSGISWDQQENGGICPGDSGGPVLIKVKGKYMLVGINSSVNYLDGKGLTDLCDYRGLAMYLPDYTAWISEEVLKFKTEMSKAE